MKLSWGTAIVLSFGLFIVFIGSMVFRIFNNDDLQHELVTPNYYQKEQSLNQHIQAKKNARRWQKELAHIVDKEFVSFGPLPIGRELTILGYCPSNASKDFFLKIPSSNVAFKKVPLKNFEKTHWEVQIYWQQKDSLFYINYPVQF